MYDYAGCVAMYSNAASLLAAVCAPGPTKSDSLALKIRQVTSKSLSGGGAESEEMVAVVGKGYSEDSVVTPPKPQPQPKPKRRASKSTTGNVLVLSLVSRISCVL